ncbi:MAG: ABC transporter ATP-binding protein [Planctomycetota bacterium]|nr:ABC transporter ATP-binding protein [Planctomycetota bacterium]
MGEATTKPAIAASDLSYTYPDGSPGLAGLTFSIMTGEAVGLLGANGTGKSTLLMSLVGVLQSKGKIEVFGEPLAPNTLAGIRRRVGLLFQNPDDQLFCPTVLDEAAFGPLNLGRKPEEARQAALDALRLVGLAGFENRVSYRLSFGEKKRVALASILSMGPDILLLDEPTGGLDPRSSAGLIDILLDLKKLGKTILSATHDLHFVGETMDRAIVLGSGRNIVGSGPTQEILSNHDFLTTHNLAHEHRHHHPDGADVHGHEHEHWRHAH